MSGDYLFGGKVNVLFPYEQPDLSARIREESVYTFIISERSFQGLCIDGIKITPDSDSGRILTAVSPGHSLRIDASDEHRNLLLITIDANTFNGIMRYYTDLIPEFQGNSYFPHPELLGVLRFFLLEEYDAKHRVDELSEYLSGVITHLVAKSLRAATDRIEPVYDRFEVERAVRFMMDHYSEKITLEDLARQAHRSKVHFSKIFKAVTGLTPMRYLLNLRMDRSRRMLSCGVLPISDIAYSCGFSTPSHFSSSFLKREGLSPAQYRSRFRQTE